MVVMLIIKQNIIIVDTGTNTTACVTDDKNLQYIKHFLYESSNTYKLFFK